MLFLFFIIVGFQQKDGPNDQTLINDTLYMPPISNAQYIIRTEETFNAGKNLNYAEEVYPQALTKKKKLLG